MTRLLREYDRITQKLEDLGLEMPTRPGYGHPAPNRQNDHSEGTWRHWPEGRTAGHPRRDCAIDECGWEPAL